MLKHKLDFGIKQIGVGIGHFYLIIQDQQSSKIDQSYWLTQGLNIRVQVKRWIGINLAWLSRQILAVPLNNLFLVQETQIRA